MYRAAQASALVAGRVYVVPDDIKQLAVPVLSHRVLTKGFVHGGGRHEAESLIARLLEARAAEETANILVETLGGETGTEPDAVDLLTRYLKKLRVHKLRVADFAPTKRTIEPGDVDRVAGEFRRFLQDAMEADGDELCVVELQ